MVSLDTLEEIEKNFKKHRKEILDSGYRFAVIGRIEIYYSNHLDSVYEKYPDLNPSKRFFGTPQKLVDIGKETNSLEYKKERIQERKEKYKNDLTKIVQEAQDIAEEEQAIKKLETEK